MTFVAATSVVAMFALLVRLMGIVPAAVQSIELSRSAVDALQDAALSDDDKEALTRRVALRLFRLLAKLVAGSAVALLLPMLPIWLLAQASILDWGGVVDVLVDWRFIALSVLVAAVVYYASAPRKT